MTTFNNRETYIEFVRNWKSEYKENSDTIRNLKTEIKELQKVSDYHASTAQSQREYLRRVQRNLLIERQESKEEAQRQYLAAKNEPKKAAA